MSFGSTMAPSSLSSRIMYGVIPITFPASEVRKAVHTIQRGRNTFLLATAFIVERTPLKTVKFSKREIILNEIFFMED